MRKLRGRIPVKVWRALAAPVLVAVLATSSCAPWPEQGEEEIAQLVEEALLAIKAGDPQRLQGLYVRDPRYGGEVPGEKADAAAERIRLEQFCSTPEFDYEPPRPQIARLRSRAVVKFDLNYRFRLRQERVSRRMRVTLFVERLPQGWRILRDNIAFPSEPQPDAGG